MEILGIHIGSGLDEDARNLDMVALNRCQQRRTPLFIPRIHRHADTEKPRHSIRITCGSGMDHGAGARRIGRASGLRVSRPGDEAGQHCKPHEASAIQAGFKADTTPLAHARSPVAYLASHTFGAWRSLAMEMPSVVK